MLADGLPVDAEPCGQVVHGRSDCVHGYEFIHLGRAELLGRAMRRSVTSATCRLVWPRLRHAQKPPNRARGVCKGLDYALLYELYYPNDSMCCPTAGAAIVRYHSTG